MPFLLDVFHYANSILHFVVIEEQKKSIVNYIKFVYCVIEKVLSGQTRDCAIYFSIFIIRFSIEKLISLRFVLKQPHSCHFFLSLG